MPHKKPDSKEIHEKVEELKKLLPRGYGAKIAAKFNVTNTTVYERLNEWNTASPILLALIELAEETQQNRKAIDQKLKDLQKA